VTRSDPEVRGRWIAAGMLVVVLSGWEAAFRVHLINGLFLPPPSEIGRTIAASLRSGEMISNTGITLGRVLAGLVVGGGAGLIGGWLMGASRRIRAVADPIVAALHPIPKLTLLPLFMVLLGLGEAPRVVVVAAAAFFPVLLNTMAGVRHISPVHFDVARIYGASRWQILRRVVLPGSLPMVLTGIRIAANVAFLSSIAVEMVSANRGLGAQLWLSWQVLRVDLLFGTLVVIALLGVGLNVALRGVARRIAPWLSEREVAV
jgi:ABC-type nitrate/sulfonate/bicarbonate transport system permease component